MLDYLGRQITTRTVDEIIHEKHLAIVHAKKEARYSGIVEAGNYLARIGYNTAARDVWQYADRVKEEQNESR